MLEWCYVVSCVMSVAPDVKRVWSQESSIVWRWISLPHGMFRAGEALPLSTIRYTKWTNPELQKPSVLMKAYHPYIRACSHSVVHVMLEVGSWATLRFISESEPFCLHSGRWAHGNPQINQVYIGHKLLPNSQMYLQAFVNWLCCSCKWSCDIHQLFVIDRLA